MDNLFDPDIEALWVWLRPSRLPRGVPCIIAGVIYHPYFNDINKDAVLVNYLSATLTALEGQYPGCGFLVGGDFNRLNIRRLTSQFQLKQLVDKPTRGDQILDLVLTNLPQLYEANAVQIFPPFGLSDHNVVFVNPKARPKGMGPSRRTTPMRDTRTSRKLELGRYLSSIDWSLVVNSGDSSESMSSLFVSIIQIGMDYIMPAKIHKTHVKDAPWVTADFKNLIKLRQQAFSKGDVEAFRHYRNAVNRERKLLRSKYFSSKVEHLKTTKPSQWWNAVKRVAGMAPYSSSDSLLSSLHLDGDLSNLEIANQINSAFLTPMEMFQPLEPAVPTNEDDPFVFTLSEPAVLAALKQLNPRKAAGPDCIPNWLLREYAEVLVEPVTTILNSSYREQKLPKTWKLANVVPLPKQKPIEDLSKHLRPISLTPAISKLAEDFIVTTHVGPAVLKKIDPNQYGGIPKSSTLFALLSMFHRWSQATDGTGAAVRVVLFDYRKAFDLIDHSILVAKINRLDIPNSIKAWVIDFLTNRHQRVKLSGDCFSEWGPVPAGVPQGTKLGPWLFLLMINDLKVDAPTWKYVDDTTISQTIPRGFLDDVQRVVTAVEDWSHSQLMQLNADKCKELVIDFKKNPHNFSPLVVNGKELPVIDSAKVLGVTLSRDLKWNNHVSECIKKVNKRLYFIVLLKRAKVPRDDIVNFYCTTIRSVLEYCAPVFHHALPAYLNEDLERIQKRVLSIISPDMSYQDCLDSLGLSSLEERRNDLCRKLFDSIATNPEHKLHHLLPSKNEPSYKLRRQRTFNLPRSNTDRFRRSFVYAMSKDSQLTT